MVSLASNPDRTEEFASEFALEFASVLAQYSESVLEQYSESVVGEGQVDSTAQWIYCLSFWVVTHP